MSAAASIRTSVRQTRFFATTVKRAVDAPARIELKMGVGLRNRRPKVWDGTGEVNRLKPVYSKDQVKEWRETFKMPKLQHSLGRPSYSDDDILTWRAVFDKYCSGQSGQINLTNFQKLLQEKYPDIPEKELPSLVMRHWKQFDLDGNNFIDFGEFCKVSFKVDVSRMRESIFDGGNKEKMKEIFLKYQEDGYITETGLFQMMEDYRFTCATTSDLRKLLSLIDKDKDNMLSELDFESWAKSEKD
ncbi:unnamed protein product [Amoebophrya sp. A120]|nr:unnamed protein product [Amoebophrya sp. A120]|eukprot:GSA120T00017265001.1